MAPLASMIRRRMSADAVSLPPPATGWCAAAAELDRRLRALEHRRAARCDARPLPGSSGSIRPAPGCCCAPSTTWRRAATPSSIAQLAIRVSRRSSIRCAPGGWCAGCPSGAAASHADRLCRADRRVHARAGRGARLASSAFRRLCVTLTIAELRAPPAPAAADRDWSRRSSRPGSTRCRSSACCRF